jgi:hypothetical protein
VAGTERILIVLGGDAGPTASQGHWLCLPPSGIEVRANGVAPHADAGQSTTGTDSEQVMSSILSDDHTIPLQKNIRFNTGPNSHYQYRIHSSLSDLFDEENGGRAVENAQTFDFLAPFLAAVARLRAWLRADRAADATDPASDHPRSPAFEAIRIVCEHSAPPGA